MVSPDFSYCGNDPLNWADPWGLTYEEVHRRFGRYGRGRPGDPFDYGRLDRDYSPSIPAYTWMHFRNLPDILRDAMDAARKGDSKAFEYYMHEMQDYYFHYSKGYRWQKFGHLKDGTKPDWPFSPENIDGWRKADEMTKLMEDYWDKCMDERLKKKVKELTNQMKCSSTEPSGTS